MAPKSPDLDAIVGAFGTTHEAKGALSRAADLILDYYREVIPIMLPLITHPDIGLHQVVNHGGRDPVLAITGALAKCIAAEAQKGRMRAGDSFAAASSLVAILHSVALFEIMGFHDGAIPADGIKAMLEELWNGLAPLERSLS